MSSQFYHLLQLLFLVNLRGQIVCGVDYCAPICSVCRLVCCPNSPSTAPTPTIATCNCSTYKLTTEPPTTPTESPHTTTKASPSPSINSSILASSCPTLVTSDPGSIIGAVSGGAVFGSILTMIVFVYIRRRSHSSDDGKEELTPNVVRNAAYQYNNGRINADDPTSIDSAYSEIHQNATQKAAQISPVMRQEDTIRKEEVYNHLYESDKEDRSDNYDHAGPAPSLSVMEDGYGVLSMEREGNKNYNTVDTTNSTDYGKLMAAENKQSNDYFILETQNE